MSINTAGYDDAPKLRLQLPERPERYPIRGSAHWIPWSIVAPSPTTGASLVSGPLLSTFSGQTSIGYRSHHRSSQVARPDNSHDNKQPVHRPPKQQSIQSLDVYAEILLSSAASMPYILNTKDLSETEWTQVNLFDVASEQRRFLHWYLNDLVLFAHRLLLGRQSASQCIITVHTLLKDIHSGSLFVYQESGIASLPQMHQLQHGVEEQLRSLILLLGLCCAVEDVSGILAHLLILKPESIAGAVERALKRHITPARLNQTDGIMKDSITLTANACSLPASVEEALNTAWSVDQAGNTEYNNGTLNSEVSRPSSLDRLRANPVAMVHFIQSRIPQIDIRGIRATKVEDNNNPEDAETSGQVKLNENGSQKDGNGSKTF